MSDLFKESKEKILNILKKSEISAYTDVACVSILKTLESVKAFEKLLEELSKSNDAIVSSIGKKTITILLPQEHLNVAKSILNEYLQDIDDKAGVIFLKCSKEVNITPGITAFISQIFNEKKILIYELISTYTDYIIIINEDKTFFMADYLKKYLGC